MINVIGLGYIGLPTALSFAANGVPVIGTDCSKNVIETLNKNKIPFEEKGIEALFQKALNAGIIFTENYASTDIYIISVPTPYLSDSKRVDASYLVNAVKSIIPYANDNAVVVIESTVSPGTIDRCIRPIIEKEKLENGKNIHLAHAPERIIPGNMIFELSNNSRTIGADSKQIGEKIATLYKSFCNGEITITDIKTAEMTKVVENTYRDINIAFANELAKICRSDNMDVYEIIKIANKHPRVNILSPGPGVGGHCISVDPWFLVGDYPGIAKLISTARGINDSMPEFVLERISEIMEENEICEVGRVGLYGLTYKEDVDDIRESPTLQLLKSMKKHLCGESSIKVYDPYIKKNIVPNQIHSFKDFLEQVDFVVIMVAHSQIRENMDALKNKIVLDTKNVCEMEGTYHI